ncbi:MAG: hypothetical protein HY867_10450 [Chloroflexi bacterium]|nr:hypothetical protein [Chloroflexota bacterium]
MTENTKVVTVHGCIACARLFDILAVYAPNGSLVGCKVTNSPDGHIVPDQRTPLVACNTHTAAEVEAAYKRWRSRNGKEAHHQEE